MFFIGPLEQLLERRLRTPIVFAILILSPFTLSILLWKKIAQENGMTPLWVLGCPHLY
jgi:hypothetical protein